MKISIRLASLVKDPRLRGLIADIEQETDIERHTVAGMLNNTVKYVSIEALAKISDYLIASHGVDPAILPGALLGRDPERFWEMLVACDRLDFCLGARVSEDWPGAEYVMATDSRLQGVLLSKLSQLDLGGTSPPAGAKEADEKKDASKPAATRRQHPRFHLVTAPDRATAMDDPGPKWPDVVAGAKAVYESLNSPLGAGPAPAGKDGRRGTALLALGSVKVNSVVELMLAKVFAGEPFQCPDKVAKAAGLPCPLFFRYRDKDPKPPSFCGGLQIAADTPAPRPGLYYEADKGKWECCPWVMESSDAAFLFYAYYPSLDRAEVACGGFSSRATNCLTDRLDEIIPALGEPQFNGRQIVVGMYVIEMTFDPTDSNYDRFKDPRPCQHRVIALPEKVLARRLKHWQ